MREYAKNGNLDELVAILETKIANLDAADTAVSKHAKLRASFYLDTRTYMAVVSPIDQRWLLGSRCCDDR